MSSLFYYVLFSTLVLFVHTNDPSNSSSKNTEAVNEEIVAERLDSLFHLFSTQKGFNGNVLISKGGKILYEHAFGYSDLRKKTPLNINSSFQIASVSKQFTAMAIMMLHDEGKINFSDTVQKFIPDFPYKNITIHQLLAHRSGLPNYMYFAGKFWRKKAKYMSNDDMLQMMIEYKPRIEFLPDRRYKYSNTGYAVLAYIVEKISGKRFDEFMEEKIFTPLEMVNTFVFNPNNDKTIEYETVGHTKNRRKAYDDFLSGVVGDKGIYSTVEDMFKWDQALYTEKLCKHSTLDEAFTPISYDYKHNTSYGYGWRIDVLDNGSKIVYHAGWWRGYNSLFVRRLEDKTSIVVLSNKVNWSFRNVDRLLGIVDSEPLSPEPFYDEPPPIDDEENVGDAEQQ